MAGLADSRLAKYARQRFPVQFRESSDPILTAFVVEVRRRARTFGISSEPDVATALDLTVMYGPDFYDADWVRDVFAVTEWTAAQKIDVLRARVRRRLADF
jgi:hypothetical protein